MGLVFLLALALQAAAPADIPPNVARVLAENPELTLDDPADPPGSPADRACSDAQGAKKIITACTRALRLTRNAHQRAQLFDIRGHAWETLDRSDRATADYGAAMALWPDYGGPYVDRAQLRMEAGDYRDALADYDALVHVIPGATEFDLRCWARAAAGVELDLALADCNRAISMQPYEATPYTDRAIIWLRRGEPARALSDADFSLGQSSDNAAALYVRGLAKSAMGDAKGADADIAEAKAESQADVDFLAKWGLTSNMAKTAATTPAR